MMRKILGFVFVVMFACYVSAQTPAGAINGTVTDPDGAAVRNAHVLASNQDTGVHYTAVTNGAGQYSLQNLPVGPYTVDVSAPDFAPDEEGDIAITDGAIATLSVSLETAEGNATAGGDQGTNPAPAQAPQGTSQPAASSQPNNAAPSNVAAGDQSAPAGMIDLGAPPLAPEEMNSLMNWIAAQVAAINLPYCYRQSYGNGAGEPYTCNEGYERNGLLCYPKCKDGFAGNGPVCWGVCPTGSTDIGAFCQKGMGQKVNNQCEPGFHRVTGRGSWGCEQTCPDGWNDTGTGCTKPSYGRGAGQSLAMGVCAPGLQKDPSGALCYPTCKADFHMVGPVCWQNCPSQQAFDCGVGCSMNQKECATGTLDMVLAPIELAASLIPYAGEIAGAARGATEAAEAAVKAGEMGAAAARIAKASAKLKDAFDNVQGSLKAIKGGNFAEAVDAESLAKLTGQRLAGKAGGQIFTLGTDANKQIDLYSREYADNFDQLTSPEIAAQIDQRFGPVGAYQVKRQWGVRHLFLALNSDGYADSLNKLSMASTADLTGVTSVVSAYLKPVCANNAVFPAVHPLYDN
jgi:hypothetical protein